MLLLSTHIQSFQITSRIAGDACVLHYSAFKFYGYANQVFYDVYLATEKKVCPFDLWQAALSISGMAGRCGSCSNG